MLVLRYDALFKVIIANAVAESFIAAVSLKTTWLTLLFGLSRIGEKRQ